MMTSDVLLEEMRQALLNAQDPAPEDDPGLSSDEWAGVWGVGTTVARVRLRKLFEQGLLETGFRGGTRMDGRPFRKPVYRAKQS